MTDRATRLLPLLAESEIDVLLVTGLIDVRYLTGYTGSNGLALVGPETRAFVTDFRYVEQAATEVEPGYDRHQASTELLHAVADLLPGGELRLGFDDGQLTVREHAELTARVPDRVTLVPTRGLVARLRAVKAPEEIERIRAASAAADAGLTALLAGGLAGRTERELAAALGDHMRAAGAHGSSFPAIVAAGPHGALPHAQPRDVAVPSGQLVVIDWGAILDGYCSDCTRTVAVGEPGPEAREIYELVLSAQLAGLAAVRAGADGRAVDAEARAVIEGAGHGAHFGHGLGHGVGLEVHEAPRLSQRSTDTLAAGNVVTVEPGVYLPGVLGVRIEDLVVVGADGADVLTGLEKTLTIVD